MTGPDVYLSGIAVALGEPRPLEELPEVRAVGSGPRLRKEGLECYRLSDRAPWDLAASCARETLEGAAGDVGAVVYATDSFWYEEAAVKGPSRFLEAVGLARTPLYGAGLHGCANLGAALRAARSLVTLDGLERVLLVTTDVCRPGGRLMGANLSVLSDGAAACLVSAGLPAAGFRLLGLETAIEAGMHAINIATDTIAVVKATADGVGRVTRRLYERTGLTGADFSHAVMNNYGEVALKLLAGAAKVQFDRVIRLDNADVGHCYAADALIDLRALQRRDALQPGDRVLALLSGQNVWDAAALEYVLT